MQRMASSPGSLATDVSAIDVLDRFSTRPTDVSPDVAAIQRNNQALMSAMGKQRQISSMRRIASSIGFKVHAIGCDGCKSLSLIVLS